MGNALGLFSSLFAYMTNIDLGDLSWLKYVVPYVCALLGYIFYNRYNSKRKYDLAELNLGIDALRKSLDEKEQRILKLEGINAKTEEEKDQWMRLYYELLSAKNEKSQS